MSPNVSSVIDWLYLISYIISQCKSSSPTARWIDASSLFNWCGRKLRASNSSIYGPPEVGNKRTLLQGPSLFWRCSPTSSKPTVFILLRKATKNNNPSTNTLWCTMKPQGSSGAEPLEGLSSKSSTHWPSNVSFKEYISAEIHLMPCQEKDLHCFPKKYF